MEMSKQPFYLYGRRPVGEFFRSDADPGLVRRVYLSESFPAEFRKRHLSELDAGLIQTRPRRELDRLFPDANHQGIVLELSARPAPALAWKDVFRPPAPGDGPIVVLDRIQDPHNLGSIVRSAEALGAKALFATGKGASVTSPVVDRVAAGAGMHLPVFELGGLQGLLKFARENHFWIVAAAGLDGESPEVAQAAGPRTIDFETLADLPPAGELVLLIGNEGEGLRKNLRESADYLFGIPLRGRTASLNAGVAAAILIERLIHR